MPKPVSTLGLFAIALLSVAPSHLLAEVPNVPVIAGNGSGGRIYVGGEGTYEQVEVDIAKVATAALDAAQVTQKEDRDYVNAALGEILAAYQTYAEALISGEIREINAKGVAGQPVDVDTFTGVTSKLKAASTVFEATLTRYASINKNVLPSNYTAMITSDGETQAVPSVGVIDLSGVVDYFQDLESKTLMPQLAEYKNIKVDVNGQVLDLSMYKSLINPDFSKAPALSPDQLEEKANEIKKMRERSQQVAEVERLDFADILRDEYNTFSNLYGADYKYVYRTDSKSAEEKGLMDKGLDFIFGSGNAETQTGKGDALGVQGVDVSTDMDARNQAFSRLVEAFWTRSYLRLSQGIQICAVQPKYVEASNLNAFKSIEAMKQLRSEPACTKAELESALENARRILIASGVQADHVFDSETGLMEAGVLNKVGSAVTFFSGDRPSAEAVNMLVQLVYADIQEELIMATPGLGLRKLREMYSARYQANEDQMAHYSAIKCSYDSRANGCAEEMDAFDETGGVGMENDIRSVFLDLQTKNDLAMDLIDQADRIQASLDAFRAGSKRQQRRKSRTTGL